MASQPTWYRNIQARPPLEVQTGRLRYVPQHRILPPEEAHAVWSWYMDVVTAARLP